ncbi:MAG TPA: carbamoyl-phosphate synthase small subunit [Phycisphaerales bacterium]|nr:carbamoyl-phosphate synthase small subunit [Phycisphaerales bacterium]
MTNQIENPGREGNPCRLALADGTVVAGRGFGAVGRSVVQAAEVVFNTAMTGYQESLTDPSYSGQILVFTAPMFGNTGVNREDLESEGVQVSGMVCRELARRHSNFRASGDVAAFLAEHGVLGMDRVDTRALTRVLRGKGVMPGVISDRTDLTDARMVELAREKPSMAGADLVSARDVAEHAWDEDLGRWRTDAKARGERLTILAIDCGVKSNTLRHLRARGCRVRVIGPDFDPSDVLRRFEAGEVDGLFVSNGPGDPAAVEGLIASLRELMNECSPRIPILGICLGHQVLALASGGRAYKMAFGHRGVNHPVRDERTGRVEITSQNHGFAIDVDSLDPNLCRVTHRHLNDGTLAGFCRLDRPVLAVQFHPEASPGPHDAESVFDWFLEACQGRSAVSVGKK